VGRIRDPLAATACGPPRPGNAGSPAGRSAARRKISRSTISHEIFFKARSIGRRKIFYLKRLSSFYIEINSRQRGIFINVFLDDVFALRRYGRA
jgi:hypothetical protein